MLSVPNVRSSRAIYFYNWTDEKFAYPWNGENYEFEPKSRMMFPEGIAYHFAKHLAEHAYNSKNITYNLAQLEEQIEKGLIRDGGVEAASEEKMKILAMNANAQAQAQGQEKVVEEKPKKKRLGRPRKVKQVVEEVVQAVAPISPDLAAFEGK